VVGYHQFSVYKVGTYGPPS